MTLNCFGSNTCLKLVNNLKMFEVTASKWNDNTHLRLLLPLKSSRLSTKVNYIDINKSFSYRSIFIRCSVYRCNLIHNSFHFKYPLEFCVSSIIFGIFCDIPIIGLSGFGKELFVCFRLRMETRYPRTEGRK